MADDSNERRAEAEARKATRAADGKKAMFEYDANAAAMRAKTERLRALRLARDAAAPPVAVKAKRTKKSKPAAVPLSDWLKGQNDSGRNN